jgi:predicted KAP-like P-loop ATPase
MKKLENVLERVSVNCTDIDLIAEVEFVRKATTTFTISTPLKLNEEYEVLIVDHFGHKTIGNLVNNIIERIRGSLIHEFRSRVNNLPFEEGCTEQGVLKDYIEWRRSDIMSLLASCIAEEFKASYGEIAKCTQVTVYALNKDKFAYYDVAISPDEKANA